MSHGIETKTRKFRVAPWFFLVLVTILLSTAVLLTAIPRTWAAQETLIVYQQIGYKVFGQDTSLDIFNEFLDGEKLIDPFSEGTYVFAVKNNSGSDSLPYSLSIEAVNPGGVPIVISFEKNGDYIYGGSGISNMQPLSALQFDYQLGGNETDIYTLSWAWNNESDAADTQIGTGEELYYTLIITASGVEEESEIIPPKSGDQSNVIVWAIAVVFSASVIISIYAQRRKKTDRDS